MKQFALILFLVLSISMGALAQELNCSVQVTSSQVEGSERTVFEAMQRSIYEFVNNRKWTNDVFQNNERIECSMLINITKRISNTEFEGTIQINATRPVYGASYKTVLFSHKDNDLQFQYQQFDVLDFSETAHLSNLTSVVTFYIYTILGMDYDSFSLNGGTPHFQKALTIVSNAQSAQESGWKAFESQTNRYWLAENLLDRRFAPLRTCYYNYHRKGFDKMGDNVDDARAQITGALELLPKVHQAVPNSFNMRIFFNAKSDEIVKLYSKAYPEEKTRVIQLLNQVDPGNTTKYIKIQESGR